MPRFIQTPIYLIPVLLLAAIVTGCGAGGLGPLGRPTDTATPTPTDEPTATPLPPTSTPTPLPPTATPTATSTFTPSPSPTPTNVPPSLVVNQNAYCMNGPGEAHGVRTSFLAQATPPVVGSTADKNWYAVDVPELGATCWLWHSLVDLNGTLEQIPVLTPPAPPTQAAAPTASISGLKYFMIAPDTGGPFGCGDGLVYFSSGIKQKGSVPENIKAALNALFSVKTKDFGKYYNAVYNNHLKVRSVDFDPVSGKAVIHLGGSIPKPPNECESRRIHGQIWETARQFHGVKSIGIWLGNVPLGDWLAVFDK